MGYPVVLKLPHKPGYHTPDGGGVQLNLTNGEAVRSAYRQLVERGHSATVVIQPMLQRRGAYELMISSTIDEHFGPVMHFGKGGRLREVDRDQAIALPPLNKSLARRTLEQTRIFQALNGHEGYPAVDLDAVQRLLVNVSWLVVDQPLIQSIHINPLWIIPNGTQAANQPPQSARSPATGSLVLDARIELADPQVDPTERPPILALRPYPSNLVSSLFLSQGAGLQSDIPPGSNGVILRPVGPKDEGLLGQFLDRMANQSNSVQHRALLPQHPMQ